MSNKLVKLGFVRHKKRLKEAETAHLARRHEAADEMASAIQRVLEFMPPEELADKLLVIALGLRSGQMVPPGPGSA